MKIMQQINKIVWWIPFKNIRNLVRELLFMLINMNNIIINIDNKIKDIDNKIKDIDNKIKDIDNKIDSKKIYKLNIKSYEYEFIFSIGNNCNTAIMLKNANLRKLSSPLDWVNGGDIYYRLDLISSSFSSFFDNKHIRFHHKEDGDDGSVFVYSNEKFNLCFPHEFKSDKVSNKEFLEIENKYNRRIDKVNYYIKNPKNRVLMVYIENDVRWITNTNILDINKISCYIDKIRYVYCNNNIDLLYIQHYPFKQNNKMMFNLINNKIHLYTIDNRVVDEKISPWMGNINNINKILNIYKIL
ncbi:papain-like cysteine peptidase [Brachyspira pilosicoli]|uniref:Papain-like cysteine peptidase n=1 Tax=Brachyspira pilosicoli TaxID=52584 RepID=A0AAJ6GD97_BRAPL|nr:DUF1796 family putative cysteine peptidase [Brachyspira pilosicoli]WIH90203.1 papain-like cysteine peptidase [Brachyspira pilosicoli]WIH92494.1 papain-like cysteine peptidase [Brachyspira pilosicoli]WIH94786.1 papain-like cysteine peptidase [Brachyspira pilosicoli]